MNPLSYFKNNLRVRLTLVLLAVALIPLLTFAIVTYRQFRESLQTSALREVTLSNTFEAQNLKNYLVQFKTDILSLSQLPIVITLLETRDNHDVDPKTGDSYEVVAHRLAETFATFSRRKQFYQKLRYIDETGRERVRVDFKPETQQVVIVPPNNLQDKSPRYYFTEAAKLKHGEIYISELDLNREYGKIEEPHVPVLRYATPVFNQAGKFRGIIISNIYVNDILHQFTDGQSSDKIQVYFANQSGYYLHHPDPTHEYGFDLGTDFNMMKDFTWIMPYARGRDVVAGIDSETGRVMAIQKIYFDEKRVDRYWFLAKTISGENVLIDINNLGSTIFSLIMAVTLVAFLLAVWLAGTITGPIQLLAEATAKIAQGDLNVPILVKSHDEIGQLAQNFELMTRQIQTLIDNLEERIQLRTQALETNAEISRKIVTILDIDELLHYVVERIQSGFNFYHTHIYLVSETNNELVMVEGSGAVGQQLKAAKHRLSIGQGIIGQVARSGQLFLATDVSNLPYFVANPLLPHTKSELALPLRKGEVVVGVLDIQSEQVDGFNQADLILMQSIADQIAVAIDNARLFQRTQTALAAVEALNRRLTRASWQNIAQKTATSGYMFTPQEVKPVLHQSGEWLNAMTTAIHERELVQLPNEATCIAIPLMLRDEVIGVVGLERKNGVWTQDEVIVVQTLAEQIALALDAARLARETQRRAAREEIIANMTQTVWSANSIEQILQNSVNQLGETFKASKVVLRLGSEQQLKTQQSLSDNSSVGDIPPHV